MGLDTEFSEIVEGSHLYFPKTKFDSVRLVMSLRFSVRKVFIVNFSMFVVVAFSIPFP